MSNSKDIRIWSPKVSASNNKKNKNLFFRWFLCNLLYETLLDHIVCKFFFGQNHFQGKLASLKQLENNEKACLSKELGESRFF